MLKKEPGKKILFFLYVNTQFKSLFPYALCLKESASVIPHFHFEDSDNYYGKEEEICKKNGITCDYSFDGLKHASQKWMKNVEKNGWKKVWFYIIFKLGRFSFFFSMLNEYLHGIEFAKQYLKKNKIEVVVVSEDNDTIGAIFVKAAKAIGIPSVIIPFTVANKEELGYAYSRISRLNITSIKRKIFYSVFKKWKINYDGKQITSEVPRVILAKMLSGIAAVNPWISIGGKADYKLFESAFVLDYYRRSGLSKKANVRLTGNTVFDTLRQRLIDKEIFLKKIYDEYGITEKKPVILCSLPPDYHPNLHFKDHAEIVKFWTDTLCSFNDFHVFISLHPRTRKENISGMMNARALIIDKPIEELIPLCDFFTASISATIRFALAAGKEVVNFDMFDFKYTEYESVKQVKTVFSKNEFVKAVAECAGKIQKTAHEIPGDGYFGKLDGKNKERIIEAFEAICKK